MDRVAHIPPMVMCKSCNSLNPIPGREPILDSESFSDLINIALLHLNAKLCKKILSVYDT